MNPVESPPEEKSCQGRAASGALAVRNHFANAGGAGSIFTCQELVDAGLGSRRSLPEALKTLVEDGWLEYAESGGRVASTWTMLAKTSAAGLEDVSDATHWRD